jgi:hypothetical protein
MRNVLILVLLCFCFSMKGAAYYVSPGGSDSNPCTNDLNDTIISSADKFEVGSTVKYDTDSEMIKLYPNPNNGRFSIEFINPLQTNKSEIIITDLSGKQVYSSPVLKEETVKHIDFSASRSGIYIILIKDKEIMATKKFIKN